MDFQRGSTFASLFTPRVLWLIGVLVVVHVALVTGAGQLPPLALFPFGAGLSPWQPLTYTLDQGSAASAFMGWLVIGFLAEGTWRSLGTRKLVLATGLCWALATAATIGVGTLWKGTGSGQVYGVFWWVSALLVWFALANRHARVSVFFTGAIPAMWVAYAFGALGVLRLFFDPTLSNLHQVFAWGAAWSLLLLDEDQWRRWRLLRRKRQIEKELSRFTVLEGGKSGERPRRSRGDEHLN